MSYHSDDEPTLEGALDGLLTALEFAEINGEHSIARELGLQYQAFADVFEDEMEGIHIDESVVDDEKYTSVQQLLKEIDSEQVETGDSVCPRCNEEFAHNGETTEFTLHDSSGAKFCFVATTKGRFSFYVHTDDKN